MFVLMSTEAARDARELQMLEGLVDCAYGLATTLAAAAKAEADTRRCLELVAGFTKCTFALRMGIRLCRTLRAPPKAAPALVQERAEAPEREPAEPVERGERPELERERDRDYEPVSLPKFLSTLGVVARNAARLEDRLPPEAARLLPTLRDLLAQAKVDPPAPEPGPSRPTGVAVLARPPQAATRHNLLGSAAPPRPGPRAPPRWPNSG
jgi:hypothetical protein